jgi:hypothetical protein
LGWVFEMRNMVHEEDITLTAQIKLWTKWHFVEIKLNSIS